MENLEVQAQQPDRLQVAFFFLHTAVATELLEQPALIARSGFVADSAVRLSDFYYVFPEHFGVVAVAATAL